MKRGAATMYKLVRKIYIFLYLKSCKCILTDPQNVLNWITSVFVHWLYLIHEFHNLSWIAEINELFHDIQIYWDAPVCMYVCINMYMCEKCEKSLLLHRYSLNWTELDDYITEFNNEMPLTEKWVFNLVILHYWHTIFLFWYCAVALWMLYK